MTRSSGFSLLELSLVIAIIALLAGGVVIGQNIIRTSEVQAAIGEYDYYVKSIKEFQDKYRSLPGDFNKAVTYWGADASCPSTTTNTVAKMSTCNGDGSGTIGTSSVASVFSNTYEWYRAWQHLSNAELISGTYTGVTGTGGSSSTVIGQNVPSSKMRGAGWALFYYLHTTTDSSNWGDHYGHILAFGGASQSANTYTNAAILTANEAYALDSKIDDGLPGTGRMRSMRTTPYPNCTTSDSAQATATYASSDTVSCAPIFLPGL